MGPKLVRLSESTPDKLPAGVTARRDGHFFERRFFVGGPQSPSDDRFKEAERAELKQLHDQLQNALKTDANPKAAFGDKKVPLHLVPPALLIGAARAFAEGAAKYSPRLEFNHVQEAVACLAAKAGVSIILIDPAGQDRFASLVTIVGYAKTIRNMLHDRKKISLVGTYETGSISSTRSPNHLPNEPRPIPADAAQLGIDASSESSESLPMPGTLSLLPKVGVAPSASEAKHCTPITTISPDDCGESFVVGATTVSDFLTTILRVLNALLLISG
jgi:hypothetical protein